MQRLVPFRTEAAAAPTTTSPRRIPQSKSGRTKRGQQHRWCSRDPASTPSCVRDLASSLLFVFALFLRRGGGGCLWAAMMCCPAVAGCSSAGCAAWHHRTSASENQRCSCPLDLLVERSGHHCRCCQSCDARLKRVSCWWWWIVRPAWSCPSPAAPPILDAVQGNGLYQACEGRTCHCSVAAAAAAVAVGWASGCCR